MDNKSAVIGVLVFIGAYALFGNYRVAAIAACLTYAMQTSPFRGASSEDIPEKTALKKQESEIDDV